jgi:cation diffusion facilitator CzcD-associated flavoprotein CzcO
MSPPALELAAAPQLPSSVDVAVIGSGFSGLAMAHQLLRAGFTDFILLERGDDVGGTWRDNSYPGCACDVPSHLYSFSFAPNPEWTSTFSPQPEIWAYLRKVAEDRGILPHVQLGTEVEEARWDEEDRCWRLRTSRGRLEARVLVSAAGALSEPSVPNIKGIERFKGRVFHSARWDHDHDLAGERVAVIGTGASAIQFVPEIQPRVGRLDLYQRTPPWIMPRRARPLSRLERALYRRVPAAQRLVRSAIYWGRELYAIPLMRAGLAPVTRRLGAANIRRQVSDPGLRRKLTPTYAPGCKRILISNDYLPALARPNVEVVSDGVAEVREHSIVSAAGDERAVDTIIFGTGFHVTDFPIAHRIHGPGGRTLGDVWQNSGTAHRGAAVAGFPNLFTLLGPNTGLGHTSVVVMSEAQAGYIVKALKHMRRRGLDAIEPAPEAQARWNRAVDRRMQGTVWTAGGCASWYIDANGRNSTLWPGFTFTYRLAMARFDAGNYVAHGLKDSPRAASNATGAAAA